MIEERILFHQLIILMEFDLESPRTREAMGRSGTTVEMLII